MNQDRRKRIRAIIDELGGIKEKIDLLMEEEQTAYDNIPEGLQSTEKSEKVEQNADDLGDVSSDIDNMIETLQGML